MMKQISSFKRVAGIATMALFVASTGVSAYAAGGGAGSGCSLI